MLKLSSIMFAVLVISIVLPGCVSTGTIQGVSDGRGVQFEYEQRLFENDGTLRITMPDGEAYTGKFVQKASSTFGDEWQIGESSGDDTFILNSSGTVSSQAEAILIGNRKSTMKCQFQFSNPDAGAVGGGIGSCRTSAGSPIDFVF